MRLTLRICRYCKKSVGFDDTKCSHCHKKLMNPVYFKAMLFAMFAIIILVYASLFVLYKSIEKAQCEPEQFYTRVNTNDLSCNQICGASCQDKGKVGEGLTLTQGYSTDSLLVTLSCQCTCSC